METLLDALARASLQGGIAIMAIWTLCRLFPRLPAALRCALWRRTYIKLLISLFLAGAVLLPVLPPNPPAVIPIVQIAPPEGDAAPSDLLPPAPTVRADSPPVPTPASPPLSISHLLLVLYILGLAAGAASLSAAWLRTRNLLRASSPVTGGSLPSLCSELAGRWKLRRRPDLRTTKKTASPLVVGVIQEAVLLPESWAATAPPSEIRLALAHELAHVRRRDLAWEWLGALTQVLFFFHPLIWLARREERAAREMACDTLALAVTGEPASVYSRLLFQIAALPAGRRTISVGALDSGEKGRLLLLRVTELGNRAPSRIYLLFGIAASVTVLLAGGVPWRLTARLRAEPPVSRQRITGVVKTPDGKPVAGVRVSWIAPVLKGTEPEGKIYATTVTDGQGRYYFDRNADSPWITQGGADRPAGVFMAQAEGWAVSFSEGLLSDPKFAPITLQPATVHEALCRDERGNPVPGLPVQVTELYFQDHVVYTTGLNLPGFQGTTDARGRFRAAGVSSKVFASRLAPLTGDWVTKSSKIEKIPGDLQTYYTVYPAAKITGTVQSLDQQRTPRTPNSAALVWYQRIENERNTGSRAKVPVDAAGRYKIAGLLPGNYRVWAIQPDKKAVAEYYPKISVKAGETVNRYFQMKPGLLLRGQVVDKKTRKPIPGVEVGAANVSDSQSEPPFLTTTDAQGNYRLRVRGGGVRLIVRNGENAPVGIVGYDEIKKMLLGETADSSEIPVNFAVETRPKLRLRGSVTGPDGRPLTNATLEYGTGISWGTLTVGPLGMFDMTQSSNQLQLPVYLFASSGNLSVATLIHQWDPGPLNLRLTARPRPVLTGSVVDKNGTPIAGAQIQIWKAPWIPKGPGWRIAMNIAQRPETTTTDAQGKFTWVGWPDFSYRLTVTSGGVSKTVPKETQNGLTPEPGKATALKIILP